MVDLAEIHEGTSPEALCHLGPVTHAVVVERKIVADCSCTCECDPDSGNPCRICLVGCPHDWEAEDEGYSW